MTTEAAVLGTPSVLVRGSDAAVVVRDLDNGFLCEDQADDLARVLKQALNDREGTAQIGQRARQTIPVPWSGIMTQVVEGYERNLRHFRARRRAARRADNQ